MVSAQESEWFGRDKAQHFGAGLAISAGGYGLCAAFFERPTGRLILGSLLGLAAGGGKELLDLAGLGTPEWSDFVWTVAGAALGLLLAWSIDLITNGRPGRRDRSAAAFARGPP